MKNKVHSIVSFLLLSLIIGCQESKKEEANVNPRREANARRACSNTVSYSFIYPTDGYIYDGSGCQTFNIPRNNTRYIKMKISNTAAYSQTLQVYVVHPDDPTHFQYGVQSYPAGTIAYSSVPGGGAGAALKWTVTDMPAFTTYELTLAITGVASSNSSEAGVSLVMDLPCPVVQDTDCYADENLHLVLVD